MVGGALDLDAALQQMRVGLAQRRIAPHLERDMHQPELPALRRRRLFGRGMLRDIDRMKTVAQGHDTPPCSGSVRDAKPQRVAVEALGRFLVDDPEEDMAIPLSLIISALPLSRSSLMLAQDEG